jgi:hypothetical protein
LASQWYSGFSLRRRRASGEWTLTFLSSTLCFNLMPKAQMISGRSSKYIAFCHNGRSMGSTAVLTVGARLGVEAVENPKSKKKVCALSKAFNARNTGDRETLESHRKKGAGADISTLSDRTKAEHLPHARLEIFTKRNWDMYVQQTSIVPSNGRGKRDSNCCSQCHIND